MSQMPFLQYAEMHIKTTRDIFGVELRYDEESILKLDAIIQSGWPAKPPVQLDNMVMLFGSFLGEAMRQTLGGEWVEFSQENWCIKMGDSTANVFGKVHKRFVNGEEDSLSFYYQSIKALNKGDLKI